MQVRIDRDKCSGDELCVQIAPGVFEMDDEGIAIVIDPQGEDEETIREAAEACPTEAIILEDDEGNQIFP
ncbi:MAG: ferredoxin [Nitrospinota bacterium]